MKVPTLALGLIAFNQVALGAVDVSTAAYNYWHKSELERWLDDHNIPYVAPAGRAELEKTVADNWEKYTSESPFSNWHDSKLQNYWKVHGRGQSPPGGRTGLLQHLESKWKDQMKQMPSPTDEWNQVKGWVFDTWTDSQLRAFLEYHNIVAPQLSSRERLIAEIKSQYDTIAKKINKQAPDTDSWTYYPGNWIYDTWSDSELREWLVDRGLLSTSKAQLTRDKLLAEVRQNWLLQRVLGDTDEMKEKVSSSFGAATSNVADSASSASASARRASATARREADESWSSAKSMAQSASASVSSAFASASAESLDTWSESDLKKWANKHGIPVPEGSNKNELLAIVRRHRTRLLNEAESAYNAATTSAGNGMDWIWNALGLNKVQETDLKKSAAAAQTSASRAAESARESLESIKNEL